MKQALSADWMTSQQDQRITETIVRERGRLWNFIRRRIDDEGDAEDVLQEVFYEFIEAYRLMRPVEQVGAWLFQVARNRITDLFRKKRPERFPEPTRIDANGQSLIFEDLLPSTAAGPDAEFARSLVIEELEAALDELPEEQRDVFVAHEIDGRSFKELAEETGLSTNTLLSRKRYAVLHLRRRLQSIYDEFTKF